MRSNIEKIADAILYEGYALFPYRKDALKNQKRFNFGVLSPKIWAARQTNEQFFQQAEVLVQIRAQAKLKFKTRFLRLADETEWQTAAEKTIAGEFALTDTQTIEYKEDALFGKITIAPQSLTENLRKIRFTFENLGEISDIENRAREEVLPFSFVSTHTIFEAENAEFVSLLEPPEEFAEHVKSLKNIGVFPVLCGEKAARNSILASPIILYDFPEIAEESFDNFFDGLEIDELMVLNLLALSDAEKRRIAATDERTRRLLQTIETAAPEDLLKLHAGMK